MLEGLPLNASTWVAGGFAITLIAASWSKLKMLGMMAVSRLIVTVDVEGRAKMAVAFYCWRHLKRSPYSGARRYGGVGTFVRPVGRNQLVGFESPGSSPILFWKRWRPVLVRYPNPNQATLNGLPLRVSFLRGTFDADKFIEDSIEACNEFDHGFSTIETVKRFFVHRCFGYRNDNKSQGTTRGESGKADSANGSLLSVSEDLTPESRIIKWRRDELGAPIGDGDPFAVLALTPEVRELADVAQRWKNSEKWYKEKKIPWRMGYLLYGKPGTGKSCLVRAIGQSLDLPIFALDLSTFDNQDLNNRWQLILNQAPCIALFEDIDAVFHGRKNVTDGEEGNGVTFDCLLNCISGVGDASGVLTIVTTNRVELLDDALGRPDPDRGGISTRPGRIDRAVELPLLTEEGRRYVASRILADCPEQIDSVVQVGDGDSGAQFEDRCGRIALAHYWEHGFPSPSVQG